ncbi:Phage portal protein, HK97 family (fragment) [Carnobacterium maltaromaticum]
MKFDKNGDVEELRPLPNSTNAVKDIQGNLLYQVNVDNETKTFAPWEIIHIKGFTRDGIHGRSPIRVISDRVQANELANEYNSNMLEQGGTPNGILKVPGMLQKEAKRGCEGRMETCKRIRCDCSN